MVPIKNDFIIKKAKKDQLAEALKIQKDAFSVYVGSLEESQIPLLHETLESIYKDFNEKTVLVALIGGNVVGSVRYSSKGGVCFFEKLSVSPKYQKNGIGRKLVLEVERDVLSKAHKIHLETGLLATNTIAFYLNLGYFQEAILKRHYGNFDWCIFSKFID